MGHYLFTWIVSPSSEIEEYLSFPSIQHARAYAAKLLRAEPMAQYGKVYESFPKVINEIPYNAKIVNIITSGRTITILSYKNRLYVEKVKKNTKGQNYLIFYPMSANGVVSNRSVRNIM